MGKVLRLFLVVFLAFGIIFSSGTLLGCKRASDVISSEETAGTEVTEGVSLEGERAVEEEEESVTKQEPSKVIEVIDGLGNKITLEKPVEKIIALAPSALEILDGLGAMDKVVGVDNWSVQMGEPLAKGLEGFGDVNGLNVERIAEINPDIIMTISGGPEEDYQKVKELGIQIYIVDAKDFEGVYREILNVGKICNLEGKATEVVDAMKQKVEEIYSKVSNLKEDEKPKVFYEVWNDPLMSAGKNTFINEFIEKAGGINIVAKDGLEGWPEYSVEKLIENNPDIIIAPVSLASGPEVILSDPRFSTIAAVLNKKVYIVPDNPVSRPSQNIIKGLEMFAKAIHPEIFGEFEIIE